MTKTSVIRTNRYNQVAIERVARSAELNSRFCVGLERRNPQWRVYGFIRGGHHNARANLLRVLGKILENSYKVERKNFIHPVRRF